MPRYNEETALIVVDVQNDFAHPDGALYVPGAERVIANINHAIRQAREHGAAVIFTQDWHPPDTPHFEKDGGIWPVHCVEDTWGARFHVDLRLDPGPVIQKGFDGSDGYSAFHTRDPRSGLQEETGLESMLFDASVERCVVVGLATDYCVKETVLDARRSEFEVVVPTNAVAAVNLKPGDGVAALAAMAEAGAVIE